jgi:ferrochelatase
MKIGILVAQLGTPAAPTASAVRRYLAQFLSDPRVVDLNPLLWRPILHGIILRRRPAQSAALYRNVWTAEGSPLLTFTKAQAGGIEAALATRDGAAEFRAEVAMRYGEPSTASAIERLAAWGAERILLVPMYPQYAAPTTGSTYDEVFRELPKRRFVPALRVVPPYFDHPAYIGALAESVRETLAPLDEPPEKILVSFHGIPQRYADLGDPYPQQCEATARALADAMGWRDDAWILTYQSRFGREPWLQPYTDETLMRLGREGVRRVAALSPGFTADCLETIDEIGNLGLEQFQSTGGESLVRVPCLNDRARWIAALAEIAGRELRGWVRE